MVCWNSGAGNTDSYYAHVREAYDRIAPLYDGSVGRLAVSRRAKEIAMEIVQGVTPPAGRILDIGCYTGIEGLLLAQKGFHVIGIDLSPEMIRIANEKARMRRLSDRARFETLRASEIEELLQREFTPFDTAYSVYGTMNLEPRVDEFKRGLLNLLKPRGTFVCGLLNPTVFYELVAAPVLLKFHGYRKLKKSGVATRIGLGDETVETFLYSPKEFAIRMGPEFVLQRLIGLHILYPPPRGDRRSNRWWLARALDRVDVAIQSVYPFNWLGFFSLMVFHRMDEGSRPGSVGS